MKIEQEKSESTSKIPGDQAKSEVGDPEVIYSNFVDVTTSPFDLKFDFKYVLNASENRLDLQKVATVVMSPQHAKLFSIVLAEQVAKYEEMYGRLPSMKTSETGKE